MNDIEPIKSRLTPNIESNLRFNTMNFLRANCKNNLNFAKQAEKFWNNPNLSQEFRQTDKKSVAKRLVKDFVKNHMPQIPWNFE